jgi:hypothetical protein
MEFTAARLFLAMQIIVFSAARLFLATFSNFASTSN